MHEKLTNLSPWGFEPQTSGFLSSALREHRTYKTSALTRLSYGLISLIESSELEGHIKIFCFLPDWLSFNFKPF